MAEISREHYNYFDLVGYRSDGPLYQLRKEAVAIVTKAPSFGESSSDMSSGEDIHTSPDEENRML